jgi:hypothetical protein
VAEQVRSQYESVDQLISILFKTEAPDLPLPSKPVITRWGTWINAAIYYCEIIFNIVNKLDSEDALSIKNAKKNTWQHLTLNLVYIK